MTRKKAIHMLVRLKDRINFEVTDAQMKMDALNMAIKVLEQEPCEDCISRQAVMSLAYHFLENPSEEDDDRLIMASEVEQLPSVEPVRKKGKWIKRIDKYDDVIGKIPYSGGVICSECGYETHNKLHVELGCPFKFCPKCGADMRSENE